METPIKPRKRTKREFEARIRAGFERTSMLTDDALLKMSKLTKGGNRAHLEFILIESFYDPLRLVMFNDDEDTLSYANIQRCIKNQRENYPKEVVEELEEAGIIENFYSEVCLDCLEHEKCHTRPWIFK
jgi:hypothetical protein